MLASRQKALFSEAGIEEYQITSVKDDRTCPQCTEMDGRHFKLKEFAIAQTAPPFHFLCRCMIIPFESSNEGAGSLTKREQLLNTVQNDKLKNAINEIYRPGATIGDGGLADAVRHELSTGELVGGKSHILKATKRVKNLENIIIKQNLSQSDLDIAKSLLEDLKNALGGK